MKKLSSMAALGLALALTFGMTVSAAESPTTEANVPALEEEVKNEIEQNAGQYAARVEGAEVTGATTIEVLNPVTGEYETKNASEVEIRPETKQLSTETLQNAVAKAFVSVANSEQKLASAGKLPEGKVIDKTVKPVIVAAADVTLPGMKIPENGNITLTIKFNFTPDSGKVYILQHLNNGVWEDIIPESVGADGSVTASFTSLSPVVLKELTLTGEDSNDDNGNDNSQGPVTATITSGTGNPATSPKTAETLPAAGVMALICIAGAAVCANKVRYNK